MENGPFPVAILSPGREDPIRGGHPWIFSNALESVETASAGTLVEIRDSRGEFIGYGSFHPANTIRIRVFTRRREPIDASFFLGRFKALWDEKQPLLPPGTEGFRLAHADADSLPGLIVDVYGATAVFQIHTIGMEHFRREIIDSLGKLPGITAIVERSDVEARREDGLAPLQPVVRFGQVERPIPFREAGILFLADALSGQKTGFYLDQREARLETARLSAGRRVLNLFSYTGGFSLAAARGGASGIASVDVSRRALELAQEAYALNCFPADRSDTRWIQQDVFEYLSGGSLPWQPDFLICDPPAFAKKRARKEEAATAYIRLNRECLRLLGSGALFLTSSCSGTVTLEEFQSYVRVAAGQAGKALSIIRMIGQPHDHTQVIAFPEGRYLKTLLCLVRGSTM
jgi:23S rRNA (cytosine1962-C5)-methyltransferase